MDTKSKSSRIVGTIIAWILILITAVCVVNAYPLVWDKEKDKEKENLYESYEMVELLTKMNYAFYMDVAEERAQKSLTPFEVFGVEENLNTQDNNTQTDNGKVNNIQDNNTQGNNAQVNNKQNSSVNDTEEETVNEEESINADEFPYDEETDYVDEYDYENEYVDENDYETEYKNAINYINERVSYWERLVRSNVNLDYVVIDDLTNKVVISSSKEFANLDLSTLDLSKYAFSVKLTYNAYGKVEVNNVNGANERSISNLFSNLNYDDFIYDVESFVNNISFSMPKNMTVVYAAPENMTIQDDFYWSVYRYEQNYFMNTGFVFISIVSIGFVIALGIIFTMLKPRQMAQGLSSKIPFEIVLIGAFCLIFQIGELGRFAYDWIGGYNSITIFENLPEVDRYYANFATHTLVWFLVLGAAFMMTLSLLQVFVIGFKHYCKEKVLTIRLCYWIKGKCAKFYNKLISFDLSDNTNRVVFKLVACNFIILLILCSIWFFGIPILFIYSVIIFVLLVRYLNNIKDKYSYLLKATNRMAQGDLEVEIEEDLGLFEPFKDEIKKIQTGFKKAVEQEVKSQQMKTELITNVSHDLKTPLTAIITYIDLLKDDSITKEERDSYLQTLEQKSYRLKNLIEDLFEVSKATTKNIEVAKEEVDIVALIKQVLFELKDQLETAKIEVRTHLPEDKVILTLDGQKTYRIFDNLLVNISKYALENTRAYVDLEEKEDQVIVTIKNISATELDFLTEDITERFVRGDKSRTTEGSGLGLAIVKSFMELQGGDFSIVVDGDLFKAILLFRR